MLIKPGDIIETITGEIYLVGEEREGDVDFISSSDGWYIGRAHIFYRLYVSGEPSIVDGFLDRGEGKQVEVLIQNDNDMRIKRIISQYDKKDTVKYIDKRKAPGILFPSRKY
jgi:hypothetical protein